MNFHILTLFPDMVMQGLATSITGRAMKQNIIKVQAVDIRDFAHNKHRKVDDYTYGGGAGMLMQAEPVYEAWESVCREIQCIASTESNIEERSNAATESNAAEGNVAVVQIDTFAGINKTVEVESTDNARKLQRHRGRIRTVYVTPQGRRFDQRMAEDFAKEEDLVILCGHYEGVDERVLEEIVTDYISIGDYVLTGGELAAMVIVDAVARLVPGVLHNQESAQTETFAGDLLEYPQYTQPRSWHGKAVPEVLLSGNERKIRQWRLEQSVARTKKQRPDLYQKYERLQQCKELLLCQKLLHMDMIELINRRRAELLYWEGTEVLLRDICTGICYHTELDAGKADITGCMDKAEVQLAEVLSGETQPTGRTQQSERTLQIGCDTVESRLDNSEKMSGDGQGRIPCLILHQQSCVQELESRQINAQAYIQAVCTRREMLSVSGLYRADGTPMETGANQGMQIRSVSDVSFCVPDAGDSLIETETDRGIAPAVMYGAYFGEALAGWIALLADGSIGMLYVRPKYRRRHIAMALETYAINQLLPRGEIPYGRIPSDCHAAIALQQRLGLSLSKTPVYCLG